MVISTQNQTTAGWIVFIAGLGMMVGMMAVDIASLMEWANASTPKFVGTELGHLAAVITAFIGGKLIPEARGVNPMTRASDPKPPIQEAS